MKLKGWPKFSGRIAAASLLALVVIGSGCSAEQTSSREAEVRALISQAEELAERRDLEAFRELVSEDYKDARGNTRQSVLMMLNYYISANRSIHLLTRVPEVSFVDSTEADVLVFVAMAGRPIGGADQLRALNADLYHVFASVAEEDGAWKIRSARWARGWEAELDEVAGRRILREGG